MRMKSYIHRVYIADGFADDCEELIHRCIQVETLNFHTFCDIWKSMNFCSVFKRPTSYAEIAELSEEVVHVAKHYLVASTSNFEETVAGLFLVFALLHIQPFARFSAIRILPEDVPAINRIIFIAKRDRRYDVLYVMGCVLIQGPVQYHAAQRERGMEDGVRKYLLRGLNTIDQHGVRPKGVFYRQNVELDIMRELDTLSLRYTEAKAQISGSSSQEQNLAYINNKLGKELSESLKLIINGVVPETPMADTDDSNAASTSDHHNLVRRIKDRAMKNTVLNMQHLMGINERIKGNKSPKKMKSEIKATTGKVKRSPVKPALAGSPKKRRSPGNKIKRRKKLKKKDSSSDSDDEDIEMDLRSSDDDDPIDEKKSSDEGSLQEAYVLNLNHLIKSTTIKGDEINLDDFVKERHKATSKGNLSTISEKQPEICEIENGSSEPKIIKEFDKVTNIEESFNKNSIHNMKGNPHFNQNILTIKKIKKPAMKFTKCSSASATNVNKEVCVTNKNNTTEETIGRKRARNSEIPTTTKIDSDVNESAALNLNTTMKNEVATVTNVPNSNQEKEKCLYLLKRKKGNSIEMVNITRINTNDLIEPSKLINNVSTKLKKKEKRDLKKPALKSKFKKMGMLPIANFQESN